jgi:ketosteroid isomerase-like protein
LTRISRRPLRRIAVLGFPVLAGIVSSPALAQQPPPMAPPPKVARPSVSLPTPTPGPPLPSVELPPELDRILRDYERAWAAQNGEALSRLFTEDGFAMPNGAPPIRGRAAIRRSYGRSGRPIVLRALSFATEGGAGHIIGAFRRRDETDDLGKFVLVLRRGKDGRWLIAADIDNSNSRPQPATAPTPTVSPYSPVVPHPTKSGLLSRNARPVLLALVAFEELNGALMLLRRRE